MAESLALSALAPAWKGPAATFEPCARYYAPMDILLYLESDLPYRADRVDPFLTLLWHPEREEAFGVKLKGFRFLFQRAQAILRTKGIDVGDDHFLPLVAALEVAMTAGLGSVITAEAERARVEEKYEKARKLVDRVQFDAREIMRAA